MSVYKHNGQWYASWTDWTRPPKPDGRRYVLTRRAQTKAIASRIKQKMAALNLQVRQGLASPAEAKAAEHAARTLLDQLPDYLADLNRRCAPKHAASVGPQLTKLLKLAPFDRGPDATPEGLRRALDAYATAKACPSGIHPGQRTLRSVGTALKTYLNWLVENHRLGHSPIARAKLPKVTEVRHARRAADEETMERLIDAAAKMPRKRDWTGADRAAMLRLMYATGFRVNEVRSLRRHSFRLEGEKEPSVTVAAAFTKNREAVVQPIPSKHVVALSLWLQYKSVGKPVFPMGKRFLLSSMMRAICKKAGVPYKTAEGYLDGHALRHSYCTQIIGRTDIRTAQSLMRHGSIQMTIRYAHTNEDKRRRAVEAR